MRVILYMATTINGLVAKENDDTSFVSKSSWKNWDDLSRKVGNLITGRRTFEIDVRENRFPYPDRLNVVITNQKIKNRWGDAAIFVSSPKEALKILEEKEYKTAFVGGGGTLNASFMAENLIDEIYLDIEPVAFGKGIGLFRESDFEAKLKLLEIKKLSDNEVQLHYQVLKKYTTSFGNCARL